MCRVAPTVNPKGELALCWDNQLNKKYKDMNGEFNLQKFIISVVIVGVILVLGIYISSEIGGIVDAPNTAGSVTNESGAYVNLTGYTLEQASLTDFSGTITAVWANVSLTPYLIPASNYTLSDAGVLTNATIVPNATEYNDANVSYTYTYTAATSASDAADDVVDALATGTSWITILVVVGFATIILTMLTSGLGNMARRENEIPYY